MQVGRAYLRLRNGRVSLDVSVLALGHLTSLIGVWPTLRTRSLLLPPLLYGFVTAVVILV